MSFGGAQLLQSEHCKLPIKTPGIINFLRDFDGLIYGKTSNCIEKKLSHVIENFVTSILLQKCVSVRYTSSLYKAENETET